VRNPTEAASSTGFTATELVREAGSVHRQRRAGSDAHPDNVIAQRSDLQSSAPRTQRNAIRQRRSARNRLQRNERQSALRETAGGEGSKEEEGSKTQDKGRKTKLNWAHDEDLSTPSHDINANRARTRKEAKAQQAKIRQAQYR
jgi:hypothetical protein